MTFLAGPDVSKSQVSVVQDQGMLRAPADASLRTAAGGADALISTSLKANNVVACGATKYTVDTLPPRGSTSLSLSFIPLAKGVQQVSGLHLQGTDDDRLYDRLQPIEIYVSA